MAETKPKKETAKEAGKKPQKTAQTDTAKGNAAVILIRNPVRMSIDTLNTLKSLNLLKKNTCSVYPKTQSVAGSMKKVKDYVAYGDIDDETFKLMQEKRGKKDKDGKYYNHYHLNPPKGGFERKGIKRTYDQGGALGNRRKAINELIRRMI